MTSICEETLGLYSLKSLQQRIEFIEKCGLINSFQEHSGAVKCYLFYFDKVSSVLRDRQVFHRDSIGNFTDGQNDGASVKPTDAATGDITDAGGVLNLKEKEIIKDLENTPPTSSEENLNADSFILKSANLKGKKYTGKQKSRIPEIWNPEWSELTFEEIIPLVDQALNKTPMRSAPRAEREPRHFSRPAPAVPIHTQEIVLDEPLFRQYLEIPKHADKPIGQKEAEDAKPIWDTLTEEQRMASGRDYARICTEATDPKFIPTPVNHLRQKPWTREVYKRSIPVPINQLSKQQQAILIARQRGHKI
jgi:hypothetical protein